MVAHMVGRVCKWSWMPKFLGYLLFMPTGLSCPPISRGGIPVLPNSWSSPKILPTPFDVDQFRTDMGDRRRGNFEGTHDGNAVPIVKSLGNA